MGENSQIEWCDHTFNPWMGCTKVSPACQHCYAERDMDKRYRKVKWGPQGTRVLTSESNWKKPLAWNRKAEKEGRRYRVFCASLADVFEEWDGPISSADGGRIYIPEDPKEWSIQLGSGQSMPPGAGIESIERPARMDDLRKSLFALIDETPHLDWLLLTKRPENVLEMWPDKRLRRNVLLGASVESQEFAERLHHLHNAKRYSLVSTLFASCEPLLGPLTLQGDSGGKVYNHLCDEGLDWVIAGGESGPNARPSHPDWFRSLRDQCLAAGVPFLFKQWGDLVPYEQDAQPPFLYSQHGDLIDGHHLPGPDDPDTGPWVFGDFGEVHKRVGKKASGRLLDGVEWNQFPAEAAGKEGV